MRMGRDVLRCSVEKRATSPGEGSNFQLMKRDIQTSPLIATSRRLLGIAAALLPACGVLLGVDADRPLGTDAGGTWDAQDVDSAQSLDGARGVCNETQKRCQALCVSLSCLPLLRTSCKSPRVSTTPAG